MCSRLRSLFGCPNFRDDASVLDDEQWFANSRLVKTKLGPVALDYARRNYEELSGLFKTLDDRAAGNLQVAGVLATLLAAAAKQWHFGPFPLVVAAIAFFLAAMAVSIWCRHPWRRPLPPSARDVLEGLPKSRCGEEWLAAAYHRATTGLRVVHEWRGDLLALSNWLLLGGVAAFMISALISSWSPPLPGPPC